MATAHPPPDTLQKIRRIVSQLEYAYLDRPDDQSADIQQWMVAFAGKVNILAHQMHLIRTAAPRFLPPLTICALYLHNMRSTRPNNAYNFDSLRPVQPNDPALSDPVHNVGIHADFNGSQYPLIPRENIKTDWWKSFGTARATETPAPEPGRSIAGSASVARTAMTAPPGTRATSTTVLSAAPGVHPTSVSAQPRRPHGSGGGASTTTPTNSPRSVPAALPRRRAPSTVPMDVDVTSTSPATDTVAIASADPVRKRKASESPARTSGDGKKRAKKRKTAGKTNEEEEGEDEQEGEDDEEGVRRRQASKKRTNKTKSEREEPASVSTRTWTPRITTGQRRGSSAACPQITADRKGKGKAVAVEDSSVDESTSSNESSSEDESNKGKGDDDEEVEEVEEVEDEHVEEDEEEEAEEEDQLQDDDGDAAEGPDHPADSEADAEADEDQPDQAPATENKGRGGKTRGVGPVESAFPPELLEWAWYEHPVQCELCKERGLVCVTCPIYTTTCLHCIGNRGVQCTNLTGPSKGQKIRACYQGYRWWKQKCRPDLHPGDNPHPGEELIGLDPPQWYHDLYYRKGRSGGPPRPELPQKPCGEPTAATVNDPQFANLGRALPSRPLKKRGGKASKTKAKNVRAAAATANTSAQAIAGTKEKKPKNNKDGKDKDGVGKKAQGTEEKTMAPEKKKKKKKETEGDAPVSGPSAPSKVDRQTKSQVEVKGKLPKNPKSQAGGKDETEQVSLIEDEGEGQSRRRSPRKLDSKQPPGADPNSASVRKSAAKGQKPSNPAPSPPPSVVEPDNDTSTKPKQKPKPKPKPKAKAKETKATSPEQPDVEMLDDDGPADVIPSDRKQTAGQSGKSQSAKLSGGGSTQVRAQRPIVVLPAPKKYGHQKQGVTTAEAPTTSAGTRGVELTGTTTTPLMKVGPPTGAKRQRASEQTASKKARGVHDVHDADDGGEADARSLKRRKKVKKKAAARNTDTGGGDGDDDQDDNGQVDDRDDNVAILHDEPDAFGMHTPSVSPRRITLSPRPNDDWEDGLTGDLSDLEFPVIDPSPSSHSRASSPIDPQTSTARTNPRRSTKRVAETPARDDTNVSTSGTSKTPRRGTSVLRLTPFTDIHKLKTHTPAPVPAEEQQFVQVPSVVVSPAPLHEASTGDMDIHTERSLVLASATMPPLTSEQQLTHLLKAAETVRETLRGSYRVLVTRYQQGGPAWPEVNDTSSNIERLSQGLRSLTVDLLLFGSMFQNISTCFEMLAGVLELGDSMPLSLDELTESTKMLLELYMASGQEWGRLRGLLPPSNGHPPYPALDARLAAVAEEMQREMSEMAPGVEPVLAELLKSLAGDKRDMPRLLIEAAKVLASGAQVVHDEREAMNGVVRFLHPHPAPAPHPAAPTPVTTPLANVDSQAQVYGPAFPTTQEVMDTLAAVSNKLTELEHDIAQLKQGQFVKDYLEALGVTPSALQAVGMFAKSISSGA